MELRDLIWWFAGLAPGLLLGWWLGARKRPATTPVEATASPSPLPQPQLPPIPVTHAVPAPAPITPATSAPATPAPATPAAVAAPAPPAAEPPAPVAPVWSPDVQALFDQGETIEAIKKIRGTLGGPIARKVAREHLSEGEFRLPADIRKLADANKRLEAIRLLCDQTHMDMPLAQRLVEHYVAHPTR